MRRTAGLLATGLKTGQKAINSLKSVSVSLAGLAAKKVELSPIIFCPRQMSKQIATKRKTKIVARKWEGWWIKHFPGRCGGALNCNRGPVKTNDQCPMTNVQRSPNDQ